MVIFHSYVSLPEGKIHFQEASALRPIWRTGLLCHIPGWLLWCEKTFGTENKATKNDRLVKMTQHFQTKPYDWIGLRENVNRKPSIFPLNMGLSCKFSLKPIHWLKCLLFFGGVVAHFETHQRDPKGYLSKSWCWVKSRISPWASHHWIENSWA